MKKFTKVVLILSGVLGAIGVICMVIAFAMGLTTHSLWIMIENGQFSFDINDLQISEPETSMTELKVYDVCEKMEVEFRVGILEISYADVEEIQVKYKNIPNLKVDSSNGTLEICDEEKIGINIENEENRKLEIVLPNDIWLEEVSIEVGAGQAVISDIFAKRLELEVGAGQAIVKNISIEELDVDADVGEVEIEVLGAETDYNYEVECGIGQVDVGSHSWDGIGTEKSIYNDAAKGQMHIVCGVGNVNICFTCDVQNGTCEDPAHNHNHNKHSDH